VTEKNSPNVNNSVHIAKK